MPYLYGFNINSIQSYIFQTGKLKEIIGGSELVDYICKDGFQKMLGDRFSKEKLVQSAAGRVRYLFDNKNDLQDFVRDLPIKISKQLPGVSFSQAAVELASEMTYNDWSKLEKRLEIQKNIPTTPHNPGLMIAERSQRTGGALYKTVSGEEVDEAQFAKIKASTSDNTLFDKFIENASDQKDAFAKEFEDLLSPDQQSGWLAVVHADGNSLGKLIQQLILELSKNKPDQLTAFLRAFSETLDQATCNAVKIAFEQVVSPVYEQEQKKEKTFLNEKAFFPLRPIILGGDDLTLIIRGSLAMEFTSNYLKRFEEQTKLLFSPLAQKYGLEDLHQGLSACAGISYIKYNYPLHYATDLSESLCKHAKAEAKKLNDIQVPTCLAFHKVQSSFVENYEDLIDGELSIPKENRQFNYGPYFLQKFEGYDTIDQLNYWVKQIKRKDAPRSNLREWLTELKINSGSAAQLMTRIRQVSHKYEQRLPLHEPFPIERTQKDKKGEEVKKSYTPIFDIITLSSIK